MQFQAKPKETALCSGPLSLETTTDHKKSSVCVQFPSQASPMNKRHAPGCQEPTVQPSPPPPTLVQRFTENTDPALGQAGAWKRAGPRPRGSGPLRTCSTASSRASQSRCRLGYGSSGVSGVSKALGPEEKEEAAPPFLESNPKM